jgi:hypothetical protein
MPQSEDTWFLDKMRHIAGWSALSPLPSAIMYLICGLTFPACLLLTVSALIASIWWSCDKPWNYYIKSTQALRLLPSTALIVSLIGWIPLIIAACEHSKPLTQNPGIFVLSFITVIVGALSVFCNLMQTSEDIRDLYQDGDYFVEGANNEILREGESGESPEEIWMSLLSNISTPKNVKVIRRHLFSSESIPSPSGELWNVWRAKYGDYPHNAKMVFAQSMEEAILKASSRYDMGTPDLLVASRHAPIIEEARKKEAEKAYRVTEEKQKEYEAEARKATAIRATLAARDMSHNLLPSPEESCLHEQFLASIGAVVCPINEK